MENGADYILRMRHRAFALYDEAGEEMDILARLNALAERETVSFDAYIKDDKERLPVRIVGMRKTEDAIESARDRLRRRSVKKQQRVTEGAAIFNEYVVLATSLKDMTEEQILELYRARWQIEKVFHRLKSLLTIDEVAVRNREAVEAWFYGKLLLAALCEAMTRQAFSPAEEPDSDA